MRAQAQHFAVLHHQDLIAVHHGADALGDDDGGGRLALLAQRLAEGRFGLKVQRAGCVVQQQDIGRARQRAAEQQAQATAEKEAAEEKAAEMESSMLEMIDLTDNEVKEVLTKINIMLSRYCKGTSFRVIAEEIPRLTPHVFNAQAIARRYGLNYSADAA